MFIDSGKPEKAPFSASIGSIRNVVPPSDTLIVALRISWTVLHSWMAFIVVNLL